MKWPEIKRIYPDKFILIGDIEEERISDTKCRIFGGKIIQTSEEASVILKAYQDYKEKGSEVLYALPNTPEDFIIENGKTLNPTFADYKLPRSQDAPEMKGIPVETITPNGPYGAKEAGEGLIIGPPPAVVNAIHDAVGVWIRDLPVTPEKILKALQAKKEGEE